MSWRNGVLLVLLGLLPASLPALEAVGLSLAKLGGPGYRLNTVELSLPLDHEGLQLQVATLDTAMLSDPIGRLQLDCGQFYFSTERLDCTAATLSLQHPWLQAVGSPARLAVSFDGHGAVSLERLLLAGQAVQAAISWQPGGWQLQAYSAALPLQHLPGELRRWIPLPDWQFSGVAEVLLTLAFTDQGLRRVEVDLRSLDNSLRFSDPQSLQAGEALGVAVSARLQQDAQHWSGTLEIQPLAGEIYLDPVYLSFDQPGHWRSRIDWQGETGLLTFEQLEVQQPELLQLQADLQLDLHAKERLAQLNVRQFEGSMPAAFDSLMSPFLVQTALAGLKTSGQLAGSLTVEDNQLRQIRLDPRDLGLADPQQRFSMAGLQGQLQWSADAGPLPNTLSFREATVFRVPLEAAQLDFRVDRDQLALERPLTLKVLDGELSLPYFELQGLRQSPRWQTRATLSGLSLQALSDELGLAPLGGALAADIPGLSYASGTIQVEGDIQLQMFDGDVLIRQPQIQGLLSAAPVLKTSITLQHLDLDTLSRRFSFGSVAGELDGEIRDLVLVSWLPVSFDAGFYTPLDYTGPRKISQKAINNLTRLGGGSAVLSGTFLRLFKQFGYDRLGISCKLNNNVCTMHGVENAAQGYYIVKGAGLPQVDVIGHNRSVDWEELWSRLKAVSSAGAPVVQ